MYIYINIYICIYMYSLAQSQYVIKIDIETQKKHIRLNVSAKAFISMTFQNPTEHTYRFVSICIYICICTQRKTLLVNVSA